MHEKYFFCLYFCCCVFMCFEFLDEARFSQEVNKTRKLSIPTHRFLVYLLKAGFIIFVLKQIRKFRDDAFILVILETC